MTPKMTTSAYYVINVTFFWLLNILLLLQCPCTYSKGLDSFSGLVTNLQKAYPDWSPRAILDIGANAGTWSINARKSYKESKILMLEASEQHVPSLKSTVEAIGNAKYRIEVLSKQDGDIVPFYFNPKASTGNSMFKEQTKFFANIPPVKKTAVTLDTIVREEGEVFLRGKGSADGFDFIKIDTQGAELMVLQGGLTTLRGATFVQFEGSTVEYNSGGSCFYEVDEFLRSNGFYLYDHSDDLRHPMLFRTFGLGQWDMLYVNPDSKNLPKELKEKVPVFCGSSPEKKKVYLEKKSSNSDHSCLDDQKYWKVFLTGLLPGLLFGLLGPSLFCKFSSKSKAK